MMIILTTPRLTLRQPRPDDLPAFSAFWTSPRTAFMGGPWTAYDAASEFPDLAAQWARHGFSLFVFTRHDDPRPLGLAGPFYPEGHPEPELAWNLWDESDEGQGLATEAVAAARDWFFSETEYRTAISYTHPDNSPSHRLAERLGARIDDAAPCPYPPPVRIYRHHAGGAA